MLRSQILAVLIAAAAATGCLYERDAIRDDRRVEAPPPGPAADAPPPPAYDSTYETAQVEAPPPPPAGSEIASETVFYERLSPYGHWTFVAPYGRVWVPAVGYGWRPYYYGQWVLTDWGWTFVSDDPWGWAAYHYGRWNWAGGVGWYWIPGRVWGPAWVNWRYGAGYVTWCPLGPAGVVFGYRHPAWIAVSEQHFTRPIAAVAVPTQRTFGVVTQARPLTGPHATVGRAGSFGPPVAGVARATGQQIRPVAAAQAVRPRPTVGVGPGQPGASMRSPVQPRARVRGGRDGVRPGAAARPADGPRTAPPGRSGAGAPRVESGPSNGGGAPRAAPPSSGGSAPRAAPPSSGGGRGGGNPHATGGRAQ
jgi:hypothetical protein